MSTMTSLPPEWVDKYEDCQIMLKEVDNISKNLLTKKNKFLVCILGG